MRNYEVIIMTNRETEIHFMMVFGVAGDMDVYEYTKGHYSKDKMVQDFSKRYHELEAQGYREVPEWWDEASESEKDEYWNR